MADTLLRYIFSSFTSTHQLLTVLDMHPLAAASRSIDCQKRSRSYLCSKLRTMRSVDDIVLNLSLRKLSKHEHSIELLDAKHKT